jgi:peptidoglycan/LPS O-acetylase OafA/YrhL
MISAVRMRSELVKAHILPLNGIRGIAIAAVMCNHFAVVLPGDLGATRLAKSLLSCGWIGVDLFFVLSGFLITGILLDTKGDDNYFSAFYARRVLRIFPLYYSVVIVPHRGNARHVSTFPRSLASQ